MADLFDSWYASTNANRMLERTGTLGDINNANSVGVTITIPAGGVEFEIAQFQCGQKQGTPNYAVVRIFAVDGSDKPTGATLGTTPQVNLNSYSVGNWIPFTFSTPISLSGNTRYWIGIMGISDINESNKMGFRMHSDGSLDPDSVQIYRGGSTWYDPDDELWFRFYKSVAVDYYKTLTENLGFKDSVIKKPLVTRTESLGLKDSVIKRTSVTRTELLGLIDVYSRVWTIQRVYTELLGLVDIYSRTWNIY